MSLLTDTDIKRALDRDIVIEPFIPSSLTPVGYNFSIGDFVFSLEDGLVLATDGFLQIPSKSTVQILTKESLWVSSRIGGTFHSRVSLASRGFSHISTTLDPTWSGPLLITMRNNTEHVLTLATSETFVTLVFFRTLSAATFPHNNAPLRSDILFADMEQKTAEYVKKVAKILQDANLESEFRRKVEAANAPMSLKVMASLKRANFRRVRYYLLQSILWGAITLIATAPLFWNTIKPWLHNNIFDTQVLGAWMASIMAVLFGLSQLIKK